MPPVLVPRVPCFSGAAPPQISYSAQILSRRCTRRDFLCACFTVICTAKSVCFTAVQKLRFHYAALPAQRRGCQKRNYIAPRVFRCNIICNFALFLQETCIFCDYPRISTGKDTRAPGRKSKQTAQFLLAICTNSIVGIR